MSRQRLSCSRSGNRYAAQPQPGPGAVGVRRVGGVARREATRAIVVVVQRKPDLLHVVLALQPARRLAHLLHRRQEQPDQDRDDRDDHQQLDESEGRAFHGEPPGESTGASRGRANVSRRRLIDREDLAAVAAAEGAVVLDGHRGREEPARAVHVQELGPAAGGWRRSCPGCCRVVRLREVMRTWTSTAVGVARHWKLGWAGL